MTTYEFQFWSPDHDCDVTVTGNPDEGWKVANMDTDAPLGMTPVVEALALEQVVYAEEQAYIDSRLRNHPLTHD